MKCTGHSKQTQKPCGNHATRGREVCHMHGGKSRLGPASGLYKHGRYSRFIPSRLLARYREAEKDAELTSLRSELALVDARLADVLSRVDTGESSARWWALMKAHRAFKRAKRLEDVGRMQEALTTLESHIDAGTQDYEAWHDVQELIEQRRKLCDSETRRLVTLQQTISAEQAMLMIGVIVDIIARHITDRQVLAQITTDLQRLGHVGDAAYGSPDGETR
jgi:ribosomal protein S15P/S13E